MNKTKILLIITVTLFSCFITAQEYKIAGKLVMNNSKKAALPKKIYASLEYQNQKDSILLNDKFEFEFNNLPKDTFTLSFSIRNYPTNILYILRPKDTENKLEIPFNPVCPYSKSKRKQKCPTCKKKDQVVPITYGLRVSITNKEGQEVDGNGKKSNSNKNKYFAGGCVTTDCSPNWYCERDQIKF